MRRHTILLFAALLLAGSAAAQYPTDFRGDQLAVERTEIGSLLIAEWNIPWSTPPVVYRLGFHGYIESTFDDLFLQFDVIYIVSNNGSIRVICPAPPEWRIGKTFHWDQAFGAYMIWYPDPSDPMKVDFELVSIHGADDLAYLFEGRFRFVGHPPQFWEVDPEHWLMQWEITRFQMPPNVQGEVQVE